MKWQALRETIFEIGSRESTHTAIQILKLMRIFAMETGERRVENIKRFQHRKIDLAIQSPTAGNLTFVYLTLISAFKKSKMNSKKN